MVSPELENPEVLRYLQETEDLAADPEKLWEELKKSYPKIQPFEYEVLHKVIAVSCSMVVPMVIIMSLYGALEGCVKSGNFGPLLIIWLTNIPKNFVMALPFQLITAGPLVRKVFRGAFPEGTVLA